MVGSGALADFGATRSDVDVQAVSQTRLARAELAELAAALSHPALACPVRGLEFVLYVRDDLGLPEGPAFSLNLNTGPGMREHAGYDPRAEPRFWFILDVASARERARALAGLPPAALLPQPPGSLVLSALRDSLNWYRDHDGAEAVLATRRASAWTATGRWLSKGEAGVWAAARFQRPSRSSPRRSRGARIPERQVPRRPRSPASWNRPSACWPPPRRARERAGAGVSECRAGVGRRDAGRRPKPAGMRRA